MDWQAAIETNRAALVRVVASLCAMIGLSANFDLTLLRDPATWREPLDEPAHARPIKIRRAMRIQILRLLRAAESACRRLIVAEWQLTHALTGQSDKAPAPKNDLPVAAKKTAPKQARDWHNYVRPFPLYDAEKHYGMKPRRKAPKHPPRISFPLNPDYVRKPTVIAEPPHPHDLLDARPIFKRLAGLHSGLTDLNRQAERLAKSKARHARRLAYPPPPIRIGNPPGFNKKEPHEVHWILGDCVQIWHETKPP